MEKLDQRNVPKKKILINFVCLKKTVINQVVNFLLNMLANKHLILSRRNKIKIWRHEQKQQIFSVNEHSITWLKCEPYLNSDFSRNSIRPAVENVPLKVLKGVQVKFL